MKALKSDGKWITHEYLYTVKGTALGFVEDDDTDDCSITIFFSNNAFKHVVYDFGCLSERDSFTVYGEIAKEITRLEKLHSRGKN